MRQALDEAKPHGVGHSRENNWNAGSCRFHGKGFLRARANEHIGLERDKLVRKRRYALGMPLRGSVINDQVLPLDPAMIAHAVLPHLEIWQVQWRAIKIANPARRPLCPRTPWRSEQRRSTRYEISPVHSILIKA